MQEDGEEMKERERNVEKKRESAFLRGRAKWERRWKRFVFFGPLRSEDGPSPTVTTKDSISH